MQKKIIIAGNAHPYLLQALKQTQLEVLYLPQISKEELITLMPTVEGLITTTRLDIDQAFIRHHTPQLKWIGRLGSGLDQIDLEAAHQKNIACINSPEGNRNAVAEHVMGLLLSLLNYIPKSFNEVRLGQWNRLANTGSELEGKTVAIIGYGNNGKRTAECLQPFHVQVLAYDKYRKGFGNNYVQEVEMPRIFDEADIVTMHVPLQHDTYHLVNDYFFAQFKKPIYFINACRGKVVDTQSLIHGLQQKKVLGAALDVLENENLNSLTTLQQQQLNWLCQQPNVIITPHIAGYSQQAFFKMAQVLATKIIDQFYAKHN